MRAELTATDSPSGSSGADAADTPFVRARALDVRLVLAAIVVAAFVAYAVLALLVRTPRIFYDELVYMEAADSFASGGGLSVRDEPYDYGPLYPIVTAPVHWLTSDREGAYSLTKAVNALLFALTAIPVYLLARRLLRPWPSALVAGLSVAVPSSVYVTVVMTESLAYLTAVSAILFIVLALEGPTVGRQLAALAACGVAFAVRPQFALLYLGFLLGLVLMLVLDPRRRSGLRGRLVQLWPTLGSLVAALLVLLVRPLVRGDSPREALGDYDVLYRSYDVASLAKWVVWHASALDAYLAVIPVAVAPVVLLALFRAARSGSRRDAAFLSAFVTINGLALLVAAAVVTYQDTPGLEIDRLHDRYLFYVVPLWLIVLGAWFEAGAPRRGVAAALGVGLGLVLLALLPFHQLDLENGVKLFSAVGSAFPSAVKVLAGSTLAAGVLVVALGAVLLARVFLSRDGARTAVVAALVFVFGVNAVLVYARAFDPPEAAAFAGDAPDRLWVDTRVPEDAEVTLLQTSCEDAPRARDSFILTEFFNSAVHGVIQADGERGAARLGQDGYVLRSGRRLDATYVVAQPGLKLAGERLAAGTSVGLELWRVGGPVRVVDLASVDDAGAEFCLAAPTRS